MASYPSATAPHSSVVPLTDPYYTSCNVVFRRSTTQNTLMLQAMEDFAVGRRRLSILSVGSGIGLFEIPMLQTLRAAGLDIDKFVGVDISAHACGILERRLMETFGESLPFEVVCDSFQEFTTQDAFDVVLYNHTFEYLGDQPHTWISKSQHLLTAEGRTIIFSPNRGGINRLYAELRQEFVGSAPLFSSDIESSLAARRIPFTQEVLVAECDISLLTSTQEDSVKLLSFLTQTDCRAVTAEVKERYVSFYRSLTSNSGHTIPHPTTMFVV